MGASMVIFGYAGKNLQLHEQDFGSLYKNNRPCLLRKWMKIMKPICFQHLKLYMCHLTHNHGGILKTWMLLAISILQQNTSVLLIFYFQELYI